MAIRFLLDMLSTKFKKFRNSREGNVLLTFALATIPLVGFIGSAVDYSRGNSIKVAIQNWVDATALALSKTAGTLSAADLQTNADAYFRALFTRPEAKNVQVTAVYQPVDEVTVA